MKLAFVTGGLEPGSGVADYVSILARELSNLDIACSLISLHDPWVDSVRRDVDHLAEDTLPSLRIPKQLPWSEKARLAAQHLEHFNPDWVSLQFVNYGLNDKGIVKQAADYLPNLFAPYRVHVYLHETWIGFLPLSELRDKPVGLVQRFYALRLLQRLSPALIQTSTVVYANLLRARGFDCQILDLFGNIAIAQPSDCRAVEALVADAIGDSCPEAGATRLKLGIFGSVPKSWDPCAILAELASIAERNDRTPVLITFGGVDEHQHLAARLKQEIPQICHVSLGRRTEKEISCLMQAIDVALSHYPHYLLAKSGVACSWLEHGVPLICSYGYDDRYPTPVEGEARALVYGPSEPLSNFLTRVSTLRLQPRSNAPTVARQLRQELSAHMNG